jgi:hypothetical protein
MKINLTQKLTGKRNLIAIFAGIFFTLVMAVGAFFQTGYKENCQHYFIYAAFISPFITIIWSKFRLLLSFIIGLFMVVFVLYAMNFFWGLEDQLYKDFSFENDSPFIEVIIWGFWSVVIACTVKVITNKLVKKLPLKHFL